MAEEAVAETSARAEAKRDKRERVEAEASAKIEAEINEKLDEKRKVMEAKSKAGADTEERARE